MKINIMKHGSTLCAALAAFLLASGCSTSHEGKCGNHSRSSGEIEGRVLVAGKPVAGATVTLYSAGEGAPTQLPPPMVNLSWTPNLPPKTAYSTWSPKDPTKLSF